MSFIQVLERLVKPSAPSLNKWQLYFKSDGAYQQADNGTEEKFLTGSGLTPIVQLSTTLNTNVNVVTPVAIPWDIQDTLSGNFFTHSTSVNNTRLIVDTDGWHKIYYGINIDITGNNRFTPQVDVRVNGVTILPRGVSYDYARNNTDDKASVSKMFLTQLTNTDYIEILVSREGSNTSSVLVPNECILLVEKVSL